MPLRHDQVEGRNAGLYLALLDVGASTAPSTVTATVAAAGAAAGVNTIPVTALSAAIPKNTVLDFSRAAGSPSTLRVVTTANAAESATELAVEMYEGAEGDGLTHALADGDDATWDGLHTVVGVTNAPYTKNEQTNDQAPITYGSGTGVTITPSTATSASPSIQVSGLFHAEGQLTQDLILHNGGNRNWWFRSVLPDKDGADWVERKGLARIRGFTHDAPAEGIVQMNYTIRITNEETTTFPGVS